MPDLRTGHVRLSGGVAVCGAAEISFGPASPLSCPAKTKTGRIYPSLLQNTPFRQPENRYFTA
ncbi:hypothetical protein GCWU000324_01412 [Kingella oralis ATCC 51147]|uniref:Uncharacterized protein n=1 Tax=Kingella oralis ATCC 51147 TaxID=629741 RepID=C4GGZ3_9NEIS|nr:hypothetical protein GCWU000324_01412 [Kingella oralis ATCC 51147]